MGFERKSGTATIRGTGDSMTEAVGGHRIHAQPSSSSLARLRGSSCIGFRGTSDIGTFQRFGNEWGVGPRSR